MMTMTQAPAIESLVKPVEGTVLRDLSEIQGESPQDKIEELYKIICRIGSPVYLIDYNLVLSLDVMLEIKKFDPNTFHKKTCAGRSSILSLRLSRQNGPGWASVPDSFREGTEALEAAIALFYLLVQE
ncbi:hypothetical protein GPM19_10335 [Halomonas sp. ZH2S]|uniref:Uncharacterized protein n=1 Tax=Vreelandella zhuhanensis TaxID=2684210 RepID=A0A7X3H2T9_9GAMM|nr:hypothetical protein [Halomonas zhuhanensis]MWJ28598.1 hypothetical protein [Halomonas zhuhanensis]